MNRILLSAYLMIQITTVGRERKLILSDAQRNTLSKYVRKVPKTLGVESVGEPDCSCHISSAMWTATAEVTIWTETTQA